MHITITGNLGSGKSTVCRLLEANHGFEYYSTGTIQRKIAEEMGLNVLEMNKIMCSDSKYDNMIDNTTARISRENPDKDMIFDSRLAWNFVEKSFKIFLTVSLNEAAKRVFADDKRGEVEKYKSIEDTREQLRLRAQTEDRRYKDIYNLNYFDFSNYNLILDSTCCTPGMLTKVILKEAELYFKQAGYYSEHATKLLISPTRLGFPTKNEYAAEGPYYNTENLVKLSYDEDFIITDGTDFIASAAEASLPFVMAKLV